MEMNFDLDFAFHIKYEVEKAPAQIYVKVWVNGSEDVFDFAIMPAPLGMTMREGKDITGYYRNLIVNEICRREKI